ncbi:HIT family protein [Patescibacteria group bacterium AH-259-L07]|nr:HIT family protein [Patescibacteria group bacterium AH-259-L07]
MESKESKQCLFCEIYEKNIDIIYENKYWYAQFDKFPTSPGHAEIIPKSHVVSLDNLRVPEWVNLFHAIGAVVKIIKKTDLEEVYKKFLKNPLNESSQGLCEQMLGHIWYRQGNG